MSFILSYQHFVWSTKNRIPFLSTQDIRKEVWEHMRNAAIESGIYLDFVNGYRDHCHALVSLGHDQTLSSIAQFLKGESSRWINKNKICKQHFDWQDEYWVCSVSPSQIDTVRNYIKRQEQHHGKFSFDSEINKISKVMKLCKN